MATISILCMDQAIIENSSIVRLHYAMTDAFLSDAPIYRTMKIVAGMKKGMNNMTSTTTMMKNAQTIKSAGLGVQPQ